MWKARSRVLIGLALWTATVAAQTVTGSGTTNAVPIFTGSSTVGNSPISVSGNNVGIGTTSPQAPLNVAGTQIQISDPSQALSNYSYIKTSAYTFNTQKLTLGTTYGYGTPVDALTLFNGYAGIGTPNPTQMLTIGAGGVIRLQDAINAYNNSLYAPIWSANYRSGTVLDSDGSISFGIRGNNASGFTFRWLSNNGSAIDYSADTSELMRLTKTGNLGIGTTSPAHTLEVNGAAQIDSALYVNGGVIFPNGGGTQTTAWTGVLCGGDYAEDMRASGSKGKYEPGDVLVLAPGNNSDIQRSVEPYSTMVAGIYATKPGVVGRREAVASSDNNVPMAMVGVVPTKVTTENGPIHKGDLLVTSSQEGYAMKGTDRSRMLGAVIGKAMGSLDSGTGVIEVLVTLQ